MYRAVLALLVVACVDTGPGPRPKVEPRYVRTHLLKEPPENLRRFDVQLGEHVVYLGNTLDHTRVVPGQTVLLRHYWKVVKPPGKHWRVFAFARGPAGTPDFMNLDPTDMQRGYPVAQWKAGDIIEDEQAITLRPDWRSREATIYVGLIAEGKHGTLDRMTATGPQTVDRAIIAAKLEVDLSRAPPPPGTVHVKRATTPIVIDGAQLDEAWRTAALSPEFITGEQSGEPVGKSTAKVTWDDQYLYVFVSVVDTDITTPYKNHDDPLWKADCIEIFIDADGNQRGYVELQVSPRNTKFDSWFATTRAQPGDESWSSNMVTQVKLRGTAEPGDTDSGWDVEIGIPWAAVKGRDEKMAVALPPRVGDRWRFNINRVDVRTGNDRQAVSSWKRIGNDWHALDRMLVAVFADPTGSTTPRAPTPEVMPPTPPAVPPAPGSTQPKPAPPATQPKPATPPAQQKLAPPPGTGGGSAAR